jgi:microcystin-dependent protein
LLKGTLEATVIGTLYGTGDGTTTFNVPDLRGRVAVGYAAAGGHPDVSTLGNNDGTPTASRRAKHRHSPHSHTTSLANTLPIAAGGSQWYQNAPGSNSELAALSINSADGGSGNTSDSLDAPAYLVVNHIIKT